MQLFFYLAIYSTLVYFNVILQQVKYKTYNFIKIAIYLLEHQLVFWLYPIIMPAPQILLNAH